jgi:hypothetical protein
MRNVVIILGLTVASCTAPPPPAASNAPIAQLAGRVAGQPQRCVLTEQGVGLQPVNRNTVTLQSGKTIWVNQMQGTCGGFGLWDVMVTEPVGTQHCAGDLVRSFDPVSKIPGPSCRLGEFVPYTKG